LDLDVTSSNLSILNCTQVSSEEGGYLKHCVIAKP